MKALALLGAIGTIILLLFYGYLSMIGSIINDEL